MGAPQILVNPIDSKGETIDITTCPQLSWEAQVSLVRVPARLSKAVLTTQPDQSRTARVSRS